MLTWRGPLAKSDCCLFHQSKHVEDIAFWSIVCQLWTIKGVTSSCSVLSKSLLQRLSIQKPGYPFCKHLGEYGKVSSDFL